MWLRVKAARISGMSRAHDSASAGRGVGDCHGGVALAIGLPPGLGESLAPPPAAAAEALGRRRCAGLALGRGPVGDELASEETCSLYRRWNLTAKEEPSEGYVTAGFGACEPLGRQIQDSRLLYQ